jgi:hypothetical protein
MPILNMTWWGASWPKIPLNDITTLSAEDGGDSDIVLKWTDVWNLVVNGVTANSWAATKLVRKTGSAPSSSSDGTLVTTSTTLNQYQTNWYDDTWLTAWTTYYYKAFSVGSNWLESWSNSVSAVPTNWWKPWANTVLYFPFKSDQTDKVWSASIDTTWTQQTLWYTFSSSGEMKIVNAPTSQRFMSAWVKFNSVQGAVAQFWWVYRWFMLYNYNHSESLSYNKTFQASTWGASYIKSSGINTTSWQWYHIAMGFDNTYSYAYLNGQQVWKNSWWWYTWLGSVRFWYAINMTVSEYIGESVCWTSTEVSDYFNQTKVKYWVS